MNTQTPRFERQPCLQLDKIKKYLGTNLIKHTQGLRADKHKMLMKEIEGRLNKVRAASCPWTEELNTLEMPILPRKVCSFHSVPVKGSVRRHRHAYSEMQQTLCSSELKQLGEQIREIILHVSSLGAGERQVSCVCMEISPQAGTKGPQASSANAAHTPPSTRTDVGAAVGDISITRMCLIFA